MKILYRLLIAALLLCAPIVVIARYDEFARGDLSLVAYVAMCLSPIVAASLLILISRKVLRDNEAFPDA